MVRASAVAEKLGYPSATIVCRGFDPQAKATAAGLGMRNLPLAVYPGHVDMFPVDELKKNLQATVTDQIVNCLTVAPEAPPPVKEPAPGDIVFRGSFEEVNEYFLRQEWSEGLPVVPPTREKVAAFLKFTDRPADEAIGVLYPDRREATLQNIAVNGVMAGCRPEYMPVLIAIVEAMADPDFGQEHIGNTPGTEILVTVNGPIIKELNFNYRQGALRVGFQANTAIGRFWRLYLRNVAGFLPHKTDKATFGGTWRVVLAENEDALAQIGWPPMSVDQGFKAGENVVTINSCTSTDSIFSVGAEDPEMILRRTSRRLVDIHMWLFALTYLGPGLRPQVLLSPCLAEALAKGGYTKEKIREYWYEHARFPARRWEELRVDRNLCAGVEAGKLPALYCQSSDPERMLPIVEKAEDFMITVSGDPDRDNAFLCGQNGFIGYPVSKKIALPKNWAALLKEAGQTG
ncbi:MAG: UGSC family (seleno)protein [Chloroflexota bacterium]